MTLVRLCSLALALIASANATDLPPHSGSSLISAFDLLRTQLRKNLSGSVLSQGKIIGRVNITPSKEALQAIFYGKDKLVFEFTKEDWQVFLEQDDGNLRRLSPSSGIREGLSKLSKILFFSSESEYQSFAQEFLKGEWKFGEDESLLVAAFQNSSFAPTARFRFLHKESYSFEGAVPTELEINFGSSESVTVLLD